MAVDNLLNKGFANFKGLDLRSSDLQRTQEYASEIKNVDFRKTGAMVKRKGYHCKTLSTGGAGLHTYNDIDINTGKITEKLVSVGESLSVLEEENLTITYTGIETVYYDLYLDKTTGNFFFDIYEDNTRILNENLGTGIEELSPIPLSSLITAINTLTDFSASASGITTEPACFLTPGINVDIGSSVNISYKVWTAASTPVNAPTAFTQAQLNKTDSEFENATFAQLNNVLYIATGYDVLYKFDGTRLYKAGLPQPSAAPTLNLVAGAVSDNNINYFYTYEYTDAKGNIVESVPSEISATITPVTQNIEVTVNNILDTTGYDTDSTDLVINLYRNTNGGTTYYLAAVVPNDGTSATQVITDSLPVGAILGQPEYIDPIKPHNLPPVVKYITAYQGLLIATGDPTNVNAVYYSDIDSPEYFPAGDNSFLVDTFFGDKVTAIAPLGNSLFVFKNKSIIQVTGTISQDVFRVDLFGSSNIGCSAHQTLKEINGYLLFLSSKGVYAINQNEQSMQELSELIEPEFSLQRNNFNFKKATALNWLEEDKYLLFMPVESQDGAGTASKVYCYDGYRQAWLIWDNINSMGGLSVIDRELYFTERRYDSISTQVEFYTYKFLSNNNTYDYADHASGIEFIFKSNWESFNEPSMFKKWLRCKIHSLDASLNDFESESFTLRLQTEIDYLDVPSTDITFDFSGSQNGGWGLDPWGQFSWGATRLTSKMSKLKPVKARSLRLVLKNSSLLENVLISGYEFEVAAPYKKFIKE